MRYDKSDEDYSKLMKDDFKFLKQSPQATGAPAATI
jgi:hypothetical protein